MKKRISAALLVFSLLFSAGCKAKPYALQQPMEEIDRIELVSAKDALRYTVTKTLSDEEKRDFLHQFQAIEFGHPIWGDPMYVSGDAVKITYLNGNYELISYYWSHYVKNEDIYHVRCYCDKDIFTELLNKFSA